MADWRAASVPGTVAGALRASGEWSWGDDDEELLDGRDWWYRCRFAAGGPGPWELRLDGLATVADAWLNDEMLLHAENMFVGHRLSVAALDSDNELTLRFCALTPLLTRRRPRPRWRTRLLRTQNLRWYRTTPLGRIPGWAPCAAPVGPWRTVTLKTLAPVTLTGQHVHARCSGDGGEVHVRALARRLEVAGASGEISATVHVGDHRAELTVSVRGDTVTAEGTVRLAGVQRWWPHTHGAQPRYPVVLELLGTSFDLGTVGFRSVEIDRSEGGFRLVVNGEPIFCRGACWMSPDAVTFNPPAGDVRASLERLRDAGMNMVRLGGYTVYESPAFWECCDELGLMVWQDCMLASFDPPEAEDFVAAVAAELEQVLGAAGAHPSLSLVCGSSETQQQAAMYGLEAERWASPLLEETIPALMAQLAPGVPYVASSPSGGLLPFHPETGVSHYFGVGAYLREPSDARLSGVRFASECLAFSNPPEAQTVEECFGGPSAAGHDPAWKRGVARDSGASWDFEDIRDAYVKRLFAVDPMQVRYADPARALDLGRAAVSELMCGAMTEWRRARSPCAGALVLSWQDLAPGAGWGLLDSLGRPKAPWYALRRVLAPVAVLFSDEGLSGLRIRVLNDAPTPLRAQLHLRAFAPGGSVVETAEQTVALGARDELELGAEEMLGGFRDLTWVYRFGPPAYDVISATLTGLDGEHLSQAVHLPLGLGRPQEADVGLEAHAHRSPDGAWELSVSTRLLAQSVALDLPGFRPSDSWFHLPPGTRRTLTLEGAVADLVPAGRVRALNSIAAARVRVE